MFWQREYVRENIAMTLPGTYLLDLPEHGLLGSLLIRITGTQVALQGLAAADWRIVDYISNLTVLLNGATIEKSLTGYEAQALAAMDQGVIPPGEWKNNWTNMQREYFLINFGRHLFDTEAGLDLSNFNNVALQISNIATAAVFGDLTISIMGYYLRDAPAGQFKGYMRSEEWRAWTTVSDQTTYNDLPVEHVLRRILLQAIPRIDGSQVEVTGLHNLMDDIELSLDTGVTRVWKGGIDDLMRENFLDTGKVWLATGAFLKTAAHGVDVSLGVVLGGAHGGLSTDGAETPDNTTLDGDRNSDTQLPITYEVDHPIAFLFAGLAPFQTAQFRFDWNPDPLTWLDPNARKTVKLDIHTRLHADAVGGRNAIVLDRYVPAGTVTPAA
jgi:hypothetical protein